MHSIPFQGPVQTGFQNFSYSNDGQIQVEKCLPSDILNKMYW